MSFELVLGTFRNKKDDTTVEAALVTRRTYSLAHDWAGNKVQANIGEFIIKDKDGKFSTMHNEPFLDAYEQLKWGKK